MSGKTNDKKGISTVKNEGVATRHHLLETSLFLTRALFQMKQSK